MRTQLDEASAAGGFCEQLDGRSRRDREGERACGGIPAWGELRETYSSDAWGKVAVWHVGKMGG